MRECYCGPDPVTGFEDLFRTPNYFRDCDITRPLRYRFSLILINLNKLSCFLLKLNVVL